MTPELSEVRRDIRSRSRLLKSVLIRQAARRAFDLAHLGTGPAERLCAALILAAVFVMVALGVSLAAKLGTSYGLILAGTALVSVVGTSAVLVLWKRDDAALEEERKRVGEELLGLKEREAELADVQVEEDARRDEEAERDEDGRRGDASRDRAEREVRRPRTRRCPFCREVVPVQALKCRHCGEILDEELARERDRRWNPGVAAVLSFFFPGLGQIYKGQVLSGLMWHGTIDAVYAVSIAGTFFCCGLGLLGIPVAIGLHVICLFDAAARG